MIRRARIVTREAEFLGSMRIARRTIVAVDDGANSPGEDWGGDYLLPGLVELHTDNLEKHLMPRPKVRWPEMPALLAHDSEIANSGITTVFDALGVGDVDEEALRGQDMGSVLAALDQASDVLRVEHFIHVRCELPAANVLELFAPFADHPRVGLISLMDHTPGQRQWMNIEQARIYYTGRKGWSDEKFERVVAEGVELQDRYALKHRRYFLDYARARGIPLASHDDTTAEHVAQACGEGMTISEFPTTTQAAQAARELKLGIVAGAPNLVRGASHSGNVSALELAREKLLDALSSDYVPVSLLHAAFLLESRGGFSLPDAIATVSANPARLAGLTDRGEIAVGLRPDFIRVRLINGVPVVLGTWRAGRPNI
ncbi:MAG: alpha-D-ribose 1-methylphosphonate 5-triphosphate diphosphatase [Burkholderiales bacterium]